MEGLLFAEQKFKTVLWHSEQKRVLMKGREMTQVEIDAGNEWYKARLCPNICYRKAEEIETK